MMIRHSLATITLIASLAAAAHADVTRYDNSDLTFLMSPYEARCVFGPTCFSSLFEEAWLDPDLASDNQAGVTKSGRGIRNIINRVNPTGSSIVNDSWIGLSNGGPRFQFAKTEDFIPSIKSDTLTTYAPGDVVSESDFGIVTDDAARRATLTGQFPGDFRRPYGDDFYLGIRIEDGSGWRYGYIRVEWKENIDLQVIDEDGNPTGTTTQRDLYIPTAWAMESDLNTPITVTEPSDCLADVNGDGQVTPTDFNAWINAFNNDLPECDQNADGQCTPTDFNAWINNFNNGC